MLIEYDPLEPIEELVTRLPYIFMSGERGAIPSFAPYIESGDLTESEFAKLAELAKNPEIPLNSYAAYEFGNLGFWKDQKDVISWSNKNKDTPFAKGVL